MKVCLNSNIGLSGRVRCLVVDGKTKRVKRAYPWQKNLILNSGLNLLMTSGGQGFDLFGITNAAVAGTGTTPTKDDSGVTTAAQTGTTVTLSGGSFVFTNTLTDAGKMLKWDSGQEAMVVTVTSPTAVEVDRSQSVVAGQFTVYRTNQKLLAIERKRTNVRVTGAGFAETTENMANGYLINRRTLDFTPETSDALYTEVGFCGSTIAGSENLFNRVLLNVPVSVPTDDQLRLIYDMTCNVTPYTQTPLSIPLVGGGTWDGTAMTEVFPIHSIEPATGGLLYGSTSYPAVGNPYISVTDADEVLLVVPQTNPQIYHGGSGAIFGPVTWDDYVTNSFTRTARFTFLGNVANFNWRIISVGTYVPAMSRVASSWAFKFTAPYVKQSTKSISLVYRASFTRVLS